MKKTKSVLSWAAALAWMGLIFFLSSQPAKDLPSFPPDYIAHAVEYFVLAVLLLNAFYFTPLFKLNIYFQAFIFAVFYGAGDEFHQLFVPTRSCSLADLLADAAGAGLAVLALYLLRKRHDK